MSGHSKWSTIKRKKGALDAKRGKVFTKALKEITIASKEGGPDPSGNPRLRLAIQNAKGVNCPKDNIERAIKKGTDTDSASWHEVTYEGHGPHGVAIFVECSTDNIHRTVQNVRSVFTRYGGHLDTNGSLQFIFTRKGIFHIPVPEGLDVEQFTLELIDAGADDIDIDAGEILVSCALEDFGKVQKKLDQMHIVPESSELQRIPNSFIKLDDEHFRKFMKLIEALEDDDDVRKVYHNLEINEAQLELM
jgi:YebC/PmpR family DNA-binding regulatory protein